MSPAFGLRDRAGRPKARDVVVAVCGSCAVTRPVVFRELIRTVNKQSRYVNVYHCPTCYRALPAFRDRASAVSTSVKDKIVVGASDRSKRLWADPDYRRRCSQPKSDETKSKLSAAIKLKFQHDQAYVDAVASARRRYWDNDVYRSARSWDRDRFIAEARAVHGNRYSYDNVVYVGFKQKVSITCPEHGEFQQLPGHHIHFANGCPSCAATRTVSGPQLAIADWLCGLGEVVEVGNRSVLGGLEIDVYLPQRKIGVEYHGLFWHSYGTPETGPQRYRYHFKQTLAERAGIRLLQFYEHEWRDHIPIVQSIILSKIGRLPSVGARCCSITECDLSGFFDANHLQGDRGSANRLALVHDGRVVAGLSLSAHRHGGFEVIRFATLGGLTVAGGLSRLLTNARRRLGMPRLFTYVDRRYGQPSSYCAAGFRLLRATPPGYRYTKNGVVYSRTVFQKQGLARKLPSFDPDLTEAQNMFVNGYRRLWDAGHYCLEML
jgi:hypothetical protein